MSENETIGSMTASAVANPNASPDWVAAVATPTLDISVDDYVRETLHAVLNCGVDADAAVKTYRAEQVRNLQSLVVLAQITIQKINATPLTAGDGKRLYRLDTLIRTADTLATWLDPEAQG